MGPACRNGETSSPAAGPLAVRAIVFDVPDVLYDATQWRRWLLRLIHQLGVAADVDTFFRAWDHEYLADVYCGRREYTEALQSFLLSQGLTWAQVDEVEAASRIQCDNLDRQRRPWPGVVKTIGALDRLRVPLAAWADTRHPAAAVTLTLDRLGIGDCFTQVLSSFDQQCCQPDARCYRLVLAALGSEPGETLWVGRDGEHLAAAQGQGMRTAAFNFDRAARADVFLAGFEDLLTAVAADRGGAGAAERETHARLARGTCR